MLAKKRPHSVKAYTYASGHLQWKGYIGILTGKVRKG